MSMSKKEMGLAVKALAQYASDCSGNGNYIEMNRAFEIALNMANMYELRKPNGFVISVVFILMKQWKSWNM